LSSRIGKKSEFCEKVGPKNKTQQLKIHKGRGEGKDQRNATKTNQERPYINKVSKKKERVVGKIAEEQR